jgi:hypothetical protein
MKRYLPMFLFLPAAFFLSAYSWAQELPEIVINDADATTTIDLANPPADFFAVGNPPFLLPDEVAICHADAREVIDLVSPPEDFFDAAEADLRLPNEISVCRADERLTIDLVTPPEEFFDPAPDVKILSRTPVIFVPGLLGTEIKNGDNMVWINEEMYSPFNSDDFMDVLLFNENLIPDANNNLILSGVIKKKIFPLIPDFDYSQGLIDEFAGQGYDVNDGSDGQTFYTFPYDWRYGASGVYPKPEGTSQMDVTNSVLLGRKIDELAKKSPTGKVDVIAHSLGGLIAKKYVLENENPQINKLVFVGVPNLGAPAAVKALLAGHDFKIFGLNPGEIKKIAQNMPAAYDLLPAKGYYVQKGSYLTISTPSMTGPEQIKPLNYEESLVHLGVLGLNTEALVNAKNFHSTEFDYFNANSKNIDVYNIAGCKSSTFRGIIDHQTFNLTHSSYAADRKPLSGDNTVPFESADSIAADNGKKFYFTKVEHGKMPSYNGIRQKIANIIANVNYSSYANLITYDQLASDKSLCQLNGEYISVHSPLEIFVAYAAGNVILGKDADGNIHYEIPGAGFEIIGDKKYVFLPDNDCQNCRINLRGTDDGTFTLIRQKIENDEAVSDQIFENIPVSENLIGGLEIDEDEIVLKLDNDGNGSVDQILTRGITLDSIATDIESYYQTGEIKNKITKTLLLTQLKALKLQFVALERLQANNKLSAKTKTALIKAAQVAANKQIDLLIKEIQIAQRQKKITAAAAQSLIEKLGYIKIQL